MSAIIRKKKYKKNTFIFIEYLAIQKRFVLLTCQQQRNAMRSYYKELIEIEGKDVLMFFKHDVLKFEDAAPVIADGGDYDNYLDWRLKKGLFTIIRNADENGI